VVFILLLIHVLTASGQEPPPRPITVSVTGQSLNFGAFSQGAAGGSVTITPVGGRNSTGDIILLNLGYSFSAAIFEVVGYAGTVVSLLDGPDIVLSGSTGGSMLLHIGDSSPASPFVITNDPPVSTLLYIGGILTVRNPGLNPPGNYSGTYNITFIQE
jgi:hypothetical protein